MNYNKKDNTGNDNKIIEEKPATYRVISELKPFWLIDRDELNKMIVYYFDTAKGLQQAIEDTEVYFGEQGKQWKAIATSHSNQEITSMITVDEVHAEEDRVRGL